MNSLANIYLRFLFGKTFEKYYCCYDGMNFSCASDLFICLCFVRFAMWMIVIFLNLVGISLYSLSGREKFIRYTNNVWTFWKFSLGKFCAVFLLLLWISFETTSSHMFSVHSVITNAIHSICSIPTMIVNVKCRMFSVQRVWFYGAVTA